MFMRKFVAATILRGRTCAFCGTYRPYRLSDGRVKCRKCRAVYSVRKLRMDLEILHYFCLGLSARKAADDQQEVSFLQGAYC